MGTLCNGGYGLLVWLNVSVSVAFDMAVSRAVLFIAMRDLRVPSCCLIAERYLFTSSGPMEGSIRSSSWNLVIVISSVCHAGESMVLMLSHGLDRERIEGELVLEFPGC